jgi:FMN phosphatase YigB (HAD superfamily)
MKIFIDFDDVIFNTKKFVADRGKIFQKNGISQKIYKQCYHSEVETGRIKRYECRAHIRRARNLVAFDVKKLERDLDDHLTHAVGYVFPDAVRFLEKFKRTDLYLVSFAKTEYQKAKIKNSKISGYFKKIFIVDGSKSAAVGKIIKHHDESYLFIDDRAAYIDDVKKKHPGVVSILMQRSGGRYFDKKTKRCDFKVTNFTQVTKLINKNKKWR